MISIQEEEELAFTEPTERIMDMMDKIISMNERLLDMIEAAGRSPVIIRPKAETNETEGS